MNILEKLIWGGDITKKDIENDLYEMCDREHACCNDDCLVYKMNGGKCVEPENSRYGCDCFKNGKAMLKFLLEKKFVDDLAKENYHKRR